jgi:predicted site-specific integrase-resolvase
MTPQTVLELLTREEAAEYLRVSLRTLDGARRAGLLKGAVVSPGRVVFRRVELDRYVRSCERVGLIPGAARAGAGRPRAT